MNELPPFTHPVLGPGLQGLTRYGELRPPSPVVGEIVAGASTIDTKGASISSLASSELILDANAGERPAPIRALLASCLALPFGGALAFLAGGVTGSPVVGTTVFLVVGGAFGALGWMLFRRPQHRSGVNVLVGTRGVQIASLHDGQVTTVADTYDSDHPWFTHASKEADAWLSIRAGGTLASCGGFTRTPHLREAIGLALEKRWAAQESVLQRTLAEGRAYVRPIDNDQNGPGEIRVERGTLSIRTNDYVYRSGRYTVSYPAVNVTVPRAGLVVKIEGSTMSISTANGRVDLPADKVGDVAVFARLFRRGAAPTA